MNTGSDFPETKGSVKGEQLYPLECSPNKILYMNTGSDFPETKWNDKIFVPKRVKNKSKGYLTNTRVWLHKLLHPLFHGLTGNTSGYFTPVVALKYYAIHKLPASVISRNSGKDITIYELSNSFALLLLVKTRHVTAYVS